MTKQSMTTLSEDTKVKAPVGRLAALTIAVIVATGTAVLAWASQVNKTDRLAEKVVEQQVVIESVQHTVSNLTGQINDIRIQQAGQTEILKYLARDRRGPLPDAAK